MEVLFALPADLSDYDRLLSVPALPARKRRSRPPLALSEAERSVLLRILNSELRRSGAHCGYSPPCSMKADITAQSAQCIGC
jgi:hypothetical protein